MGLAFSCPASLSSRPLDILPLPFYLTLHKRHTFPLTSHELVSTSLHSSLLTLPSTHPAILHLSSKYSPWNASPFVSSLFLHSPCEFLPSSLSPTSLLSLDSTNTIPLPLPLCLARSNYTLVTCLPSPRPSPLHLSIPSETKGQVEEGRVYYSGVNNI